MKPLLKFSQQKYHVVARMSFEGAPAPEPEVEVLQRAMSNFERYHELPAGVATLEQVQASSAGVDGWASVSIEAPAS